MSLAGLPAILIRSRPDYRPEHDTSSMSKLERAEYEADRALYDALKDSDPWLLTSLGVDERGFAAYDAQSAVAGPRLTGNTGTR